MSAIITSEIRTQNTINFYSGFFPSSGTTDNSLYMAFGRDTAWPADINGKLEDDPSFIVPVPVDATAGSDFRSEVIAGYKIHFNEFCPVIARVDWAVSQTYTAGTVVITDEYNVYYATTSITSDTKPTHTNGVINSWEFLYKISVVDYITNFMTADWIPVYYAGNVGTTGVPDVESMKKTNCRYLMASVTLTESVISIANLSDFRKIALWGTPLASGGGYLTTDTFITSGIDTTSGTVVYVDHRLPTYRSSGQVERLRTIIGF